MHAAPRGVFGDFGKMVGWIHLEELAVVGEFGLSSGLDTVQRVAERHFAIFVMVTVAFTVGRDVRKLRPASLIRESAKQATGEDVAVIQEAFKRHGPRNWSVVKENGDRILRRKPDSIGPAGIDARSGYVFPRAAAVSADALCLAWGQNREPNFLGRQHFKRSRVDRCFRQPHAFRATSKSRHEIGYAPDHLGFFVAWMSQRKNHVVIHLCNRRTVASIALLARFICLLDRLE